MAAFALRVVDADHVPSFDEERQIPRTGSGGGSGATFAAYAHRIYQDPRADGPTRQLLLAIAYALTMAPAKDGTSVWATIRAALGPDTSRIALRRLIIKDLPRENPDRGGLLPCYFDADWLHIYRWATTRTTWQPPAQGLRADDSPAPPPQRPRLHLVAPPG
ncbi:hypothetical protein ACWEKM_24645 [Streptomyces sp. NPDC004752]